MINVSSLSEYAYCPRKLYYRLVENMKEEETKSLVLGRIKHKILSDINKEEEFVIKNIKNFMEENEIYMNFIRTYFSVVTSVVGKSSDTLIKFNVDPRELSEKLFEALKERARINSKMVLDIMNVKQVFGSDLIQSVPKAIVQDFIKNEELELKGYVDRIEVNNGEYVPVEIKSGKLSNLIGNKLQLTGYCMLVEKKYFTIVSRGFLEYVDLNQRIDINPGELKKEVFNIRDNIKLLLDKKDLPERVKDRRKCLSCSFYQRCYNLDQ